MQGWRKRMEDAHITDLSKGKNKSINVFGVFDGHGGKEISQYVKNHFTDELLNNSKYKEGDMVGALRETFFKMDEIMQSEEGIKEIKEIARKSKKEDDEQNKNETSSNNQMDLLAQLLGPLKDPESNDINMRTGCTACVCVIDEDNKKIYFANAGDSRVVICRKNVAYGKSEDHKPDLPRERERIQKADGWISEGRVKGALNLSRGLGDLEYKQNKNLPAKDQMITADPDIQIDDLTPDIDFIIIGCDGIWDCLKNQDAADFVRTRITPNKKISGIIEEMMDSIIAKDINSETSVGCDNMTCIVIVPKKN